MTKDVCHVAMRIEVKELLVTLKSFKAVGVGRGGLFGLPDGNVVAVEYRIPDYSYTVNMQITLEGLKSEQEKRYDNHIPAGEPIIFFEVTPGDASEFAGVLRVCGERVDGYRVLRAESPAVPNAIAAFLLHLRDQTGQLPHIYFGWSEGNPLTYLLKYIVFGEGDTAPVTHEVLRQAEEDPERRPVVHVGG